MSQGAFVEFAEDLSGAGNGTVVYLPLFAQGCAVTLQIASGTSKIQSTTDTRAQVAAGSAVWVDWPSGAVAVTTQDYVRNVTALRGVCVSGSCRVMLRAS